MDRRLFFKRVAIAGTAAVVAPTLLCDVKVLERGAVWEHRDIYSKIFNRYNEEVLFDFLINKGRREFDRSRETFRWEIISPEDFEKTMNNEKT